MIRQIRNPLMIAIFVLFLVVFLFQVGIIDQILTISILYAGGITILNFIVFSFMYVKSVNKKNKNFLIINLGGMVLRLFFVLLTVFIVIKFLKVDVIGFIFTLLILYILFLIAEIMIINRLGKSFNSTKNA